MTVTTTNLTGNATDTVIATLNMNRDLSSDQKVRVSAIGDFGGGTMTFNYSLDGGTTKSAWNASLAGSAISLTDDDTFSWDATIYNGANPIILYATLSGATSPDVDVIVANPWEK